VNFRISARVVSQLGAELISSDEVAIFELVKNGFDARSQAVEVSISFRAAASLIGQLQQPAIEWAKENGFSSKCPAEVREAILARIAQVRILATQQYSLLSADDWDALSDAVKSADTTGTIIQLLGKVNSIDVNDSGTGMTAAEVQQYYLTIGTTHRLKEVESIQRGHQTGEVPAGEKGIGRLSAMRLGNELELLSVSEASNSAVYVGINWREFDFRRDDDLQAVPVRYEEQPRNDASPGTLITISALANDWPRKKAEKLGTDHLAKFIDPFPRIFEEKEARSSGKQVILKWNGEPINTKELLGKYLDAAQNVGQCRLLFSESGQAMIESEFRYGGLRTRALSTKKRVYTIADFSRFTNEQLREVGAFEFSLFHFPRNRLKAIPQFASRSEVKEWLDRWSGGLMVFRDGVRVLPYGAEGDDWLNLDAQALRGRGFRVNRIQVVGFVRISRLQNPQLIDQTNREGFRDNEAFRTFRALLQRHIQDNFVSGLDAHLSLEKPDFEQLGRSVAQEYNVLNDCAETLQRATKSQDWGLAQEGVHKLRSVLDGLGDLNDAVEKALAEKEGNRVQVLELAATGMAAEAMAHDLEGVVETAIASLNDVKLRDADSRVSSAVRHIRSVHKALLIQIKQISPGPAKSRRRASEFDLVPIIREAASFYDEKCRRHGISISLPPENLALEVRAVPGHLRQILDNLFRNATYWLSDTNAKFPHAPPARISLSVDPIARIVRFSDTGIGIAVEDADWVFQPFNSRREEGRGLGLFICKELAEFNKVDIRLDLSTPNQFGRFSTFALTFDALES
jgi:signal transduction histidine kinase